MIANQVYCSLMTIPTDSSRRFYLRERRNAAGLTQEQLAAACDTTKGMISQLETGRTRYNETWVERVADALGVPPACLFIHPDEGLPGLTDDGALKRVIAAWPEIAEPRRESIAALVETFKDGLSSQ